MSSRCWRTRRGRRTGRPPTRPSRSRWPASPTSSGSRTKRNRPDRYQRRGRVRKTVECSFFNIIHQTHTLLIAPGLYFQPRKASATCSSATAAASSGLEDWSARSPRQRDSDPSHSDLTTAPSTNNKPPSPAGAALILSKPPSPCAPGNTHTHTALALA